MGFHTNTVFLSTQKPIVAFGKHVSQPAINQIYQPVSLSSSLPASQPASQTACQSCQPVQPSCQPAIKPTSQPASNQTYQPASEQTYQPVQLAAVTSTHGPSTHLVRAECGGKTRDGGDTTAGGPAYRPTSCSNAIQAQRFNFINTVSKWASEVQFCLT